MKELSNLLKSYFNNDNDIEISYINNEILIEINEKRNIRELRIFYHNEFIYINDFSYEDENNQDENELFRINYLLYEYNENKMNLLILNMIQDFIDIIE